MGHTRNLLLGMLLALLSPLVAQVPGFVERGAPKPPPPPATRVLDEAGLFSREPDRLKEMSYRLLAFERDHGVAIYVVIYPGIFDGDATSQARLLHESWVGEKDGIVVVCDTDSRDIDFGLPSGSLPDPEGGAAMTRLPPYRLLPIIRDLRQELGEEGDRVEYLDQLTEILTTRLGESLAAEPEGAGATLKYIGLGAAGAAALCLVGFFVNRRLRAAEDRARIRFFFPEVHVATRLGAPCGGGRTSVVRFGSPGTGDR